MKFKHPKIFMDSIIFSPVEGTGNLPVSWIHGSNRKKDQINPPIQIHKYNEHTIILRQSKDISFEAPFLFLLFGNKRAILIDTGATTDEKTFPLRRTVDDLINEWLTNNRRENYELIIAHTHGHSDHRAGDNQFLGRENTIIIQKDVESVKKFFGIKNWPEEIVEFDLGNRTLDILPTPGHDTREIAIYDRWTKILLTGDIIYPGRLYVMDYNSFLKSLEKLVLFSKEHEIKYMLGCHIEMMNTPGKDYPLLARYQPQEPPLEMEVEQIHQILDKAKSIRSKGGVYTSDNFILWIGPCYIARIKHLLRGIIYNIRN